MCIRDSHHSLDRFGADQIDQPVEELSLGIDHPHRVQRPAQVPVGGVDEAHVPRLEGATDRVWEARRRARRERRGKSGEGDPSRGPGRTAYSPAMGADVDTITYTREQRQRYREKVQQCLDVFERMLSFAHFEFDRPMTGMEIELNLVGADFRPRMDNAKVLEHIADPEYQTELGRYNIEFNVAPRPLPGNSAMELEEVLRTSLNRAQAKCMELDNRIIMICLLYTSDAADERSSVDLGGRRIIKKKNINKKKRQKNDYQRTTQTCTSS